MSILFSHVAPRLTRGYSRFHLCTRDVCVCVCEGGEVSFGINSRGICNFSFTWKRVGGQALVLDCGIQGRQFD